VEINDLHEPNPNFENCSATASGCHRNHDKKSRKIMKINDLRETYPENQRVARATANGLE
jgi:hypothetical protein